MSCTEEKPCLSPVLRWVHSAACRASCREGPAPKPKRYHYAAKIRSDGQVSALCFDPPHAIDLRRASWTNRREAVTCPRCLDLLVPSPATRAPAKETDRE
jgi:hypothetical protein